MRHADPHPSSLRLAAATALAFAAGAIAPAHASTARATASLPATATTAVPSTAATAAAPATAGTLLSAALSTEELTVGEAASVTGRLLGEGQPRAGVALTLESDPYPYRGFVVLARAATAADGSFSFTGIRPDRNTRLRVLSEGASSAVSAPLELIVDPKLIGRARSLGPGRVRLTIRVRHAVTAETSEPLVRWFLAARRSRVFRLADSTAARELAPGVTYASVVVDPPVRRFVWRVCMNPSWEGAMGTPASHRRCPEATFVAGHDAR
jgi:hypothetical protein